MLIFDAHLDLSLNALEYNRDLRLTIRELRESEDGMTDLKGRGRSTVTFPEMRRAGVGLCVATQIAGCMKPAGPVASWNSPPQAWAMTQGQLAWYHAMEELGELRQVRSWSDVKNHLAEWNLSPEKTPIGYILSLEGADSIRELSDLEKSWEQGLRALGPAHYGKGRYALGHDQEGSLPSSGKDLLREMDRLGMILDVTHLCTGNFWDALEVFHGPVWASHHNCRSLVDDPRQLDDEQIKALAERGAVIGAAFDVWMVAPGWQRRKTEHPHLPGADLEGLANHVDHVCQLLGTSRHCGIGTDLDGGFGNEQTPSDMDTINDLLKFKETLNKRGYSKDDLDGIFNGNYLSFLEKAWS
ncbi:MAG TPA: peptidase M19 [Verrucomicrobiales bacterium]|nr:peptidase M19 [Verrucomicrobiales bacterium]HIL68306.1 peptidase M19 [Verrucomicrobiota bacterium]